MTGGAKAEWPAAKRRKAAKQRLRLEGSYSLGIPTEYTLRGEDLIFFQPHHLRRGIHVFIT
jgi:hypothetical protein